MIKSRRRFQGFIVAVVMTLAPLVGWAAPASAAASTTPPSEPPRSEIIAGAFDAGPLEVATLRERDGIRNGPGYRGGTIHYPTEGDGPFPIMIVCPGFQASEGSVRPWGRFLASHGIVTMTIGTNSPRDMPIARGRALLDALETVRAEHRREESPLHERLDVEKAGVAGWSMGGGGAQHAAMLDPTLDAVVAMVPWQPLIRFEHPVPVLIIAGDRDEIASTRKHARPHFESTPSTTPRLLFEIRGGNHFLPSSPENHEAEVGAITLAWIKAFVAGDDRYRELVRRRPKTASIYELDLVEPTGTDSPEDSKTPATD